MSDLKRYFEISKVDAEQRMVWGYASTEAVDAQGETVTKAAMEAAWDEYMKFANIREMHQPSAVGIVKEYEFRDQGVFIGAHVVDDVAWAKVAAGVYKGFSIGGKKLPGGYDAISKTISALRLTEISLVDRPANPEALIEMFKADMENDSMSDPSAATVDKLKELVQKGNISPERLLELVAQEVNKSEPATAGQDAPQAAQDTSAPQESATPQEPVQVDKADSPKLNVVQRALRAVAGGEEAVRKGIYDVGSLASLLSTLRWIQAESKAEAEMEGDASPVPAKLADLARAMGEVLVEMAQEEVAELLATLKVDGGDKQPLDLLTDKLVEAMQHPKDTGAVTKADTEAPAEDVVTKVDTPEADAIAKAVGAATAELVEKFEALSGKLDAATTAYDALKTAHDDLEKRWAKSPTAPKAAVMAIAKAQDGDPLLSTQAANGPILKQDGTVDVEAEIRKVHQSGGRPLGQR